MTIYLLTLFPEYFLTPLQQSMLKRAQTAGQVEYKVVNIRDFASGKHQISDDRPFGGGPGMVMKVEPIHEALRSIGADLAVGQRPAKSKIILTSAKGRAFTQTVAREYAQLDHLIIVCGHYEGVDERVAEYLVDEEVRIGEYVLTGGEPAALVMADAVTRLLPGVLGNDNSTQGESHDQPGVLGHPQYTRPAEYQGWAVPPVLVGGDHHQIEKWREEQR